ncbi:MAG TPA: hypothetical protein DDZ80_29035, partial [Cyanobacteria bacterium UBA8803]|nr:hypothetical protein [Cyanobacteria bacterium UBA8803]
QCKKYNISAPKLAKTHTSNLYPVRHRHHSTKNKGFGDLASGVDEHLKIAIKPRYHNTLIGFGVWGMGKVPAVRSPFIIGILSDIDKLMRSLKIRLL